MTSNDNGTRGGGLAKPGMIGRLHEREALIAVVRRAIDEQQPQLVTIVGSAGVGKSRLVTESLADLAEILPELRAYRGAGRPGAGLQPALARILRTRLGLQDGADPIRQAREMRAQVTELFGDLRVHEILHFLGAFLGLKFGGTPLADAIEDDTRAFQQVARAVLRRFFEVDAQRAPLLLVFDDVHHANADGVALLRELAETLSVAPVVIVATARPDLLARVRDWPDVLPGRHTRLDLGPLSVSESQAMVRALLPRTRDVPPVLITTVAELSAGNPLLIEQLVRFFYDRGVLAVGADGVLVAVPERLEGLALPLSVEDAARSRVAALTPPERELLERAAVMGPAFWLGGLVVLGRSRKDVPDLWGGGEDLAPHYRDVLHGLAQRDYVVPAAQSTIADDHEWVFKHAHDREAVLALVSAEDALTYHRILAEWLDLRLGERSEEQLDLLAHHYEHGERPLRAARCYLESADRARARYASTKAAEHYQRGLALLGEHDVRRRLDAHHHLGDVLQSLGRVDEAHAQFRRMLGLAYQLDLKAKGGAAHNRVGRLYRETGHLDMAMRHLGTALALFEAAADARGIASSFDDIGMVHWLRGSFDQALRYMQDALARREALQDRRSIALSLNNVGLVFQDSGQYPAALDALTRALELRRAVDDLAGVAMTLNNLGTIYHDRGDDAEAVRLWLQGLEVAREIGDRRLQAVLMLNVGEGRYRLRDLDESIRILLDVERVCREIGDRILLAEAWRGLGKAHLLRGDVVAAQRHLERAVELFGETRSRVQLGVARRTLGECLAAWGYDSEHGRRSERVLREALEVFDEAGAELEYARTARVLAELLRQAPVAAGAGLADEADRLRLRADEIFAKLRSGPRDAAGALRVAPGDAEIGAGARRSSPALGPGETGGAAPGGLFDTTDRYPTTLGPAARPDAPPREA